MPHRESLSGLMDPDGTDKDTGEEEIAGFFGEQFQIQFDEIIEGINQDEPQIPGNDFWQRWAGIFAAFLIPEFTSFATQAAETQFDDLAIGVDFDQVLENASNFASTHAFQLVTDLNIRTQKRLQQVISNFLADPERDFSALVENLSATFGPSRAANIAVTETTRAFEAGKDIYIDQLRRIGVKTEPVWHTMQDEIVCPICEPNDGKRKSEGWTVPGIPAHPRDRCWTTLVVVN